MYYFGSLKIRVATVVAKFGLEVSKTKLATIVVICYFGGLRNKDGNWSCHIYFGNRNI